MPSTSQSQPSDYRWNGRQVTPKNKTNGGFHQPLPFAPTHLLHRPSNWRKSRTSESDFRRDFCTRRWTPHPWKGGKRPAQHVARPRSEVFGRDVFFLKSSRGRSKNHGAYHLAGAPGWMGPQNILFNIQWWWTYTWPKINPNTFQE